jgi:hypothetical protein
MDIQDTQDKTPTLREDPMARPSFAEASAFVKTTADRSERQGSELKHPREIKHGWARYIG